MSLQSRLAALITAIGADIKALQNNLGNRLPANETGTPLDTERVGWRRTSDGALIAEIDAITTAGADRRGHVKVRGLSDGSGERAQVDLEARSSNPSAVAMLFMQNAPYSATRKRRASVQLTDDSGGITYTRDIFRSDGSSDFLLAADWDFAQRGRVRIHTPIDHAPGALTVAGTYTPQGGRCWAVFNGSGFFPGGGGQFGIDFLHDGVFLAVSNAFANEGWSHKVIGPRWVSLGTPSAGVVHTVQLRAGSPGGVETGTDGNDYFSCAIIELG